MSDSTTSVAFFNQLPSILAGIAALIGAVAAAWVSITNRLDKQNVVLESTAKAVDGQMSEYKKVLQITSDLKEEIAALRAGKEAGDAARLRASELAAAHSLPPVDRSSALVDQQGDRIEKTTLETHSDVKDVKGSVQKVETQLGGRVGEVEAKLHEKKDKEKS